MIEVAVKTHDGADAKFLTGQRHQGVVKIQPALVLTTLFHDERKQALCRGSDPGDA